MKKFVKGFVVGLAVNAALVGLVGCNLRSGFSGNLNTEETTGSKANKTTDDLEYQGSIVDEETLKRVSDIESIIDKYYYFETTDEDIKNGMYKGMLEGLDDPYAKYYTKEEYAKLMEDDSGEYAGIGVSVNQDPDTGLVKVVKLLDGAPAWDVDIQPDDYIVQIDDYEITKDDDLDYLVTLIRGEVGTTVDLKLYRESDKDYHTVTITRQIVENKTIDYYMIDDSIGYIQITQFITNTGDLFRDALKDLKSQGMKALMIDLRDNPGGMLSTVVDICDCLLPEGKIVYQKDKNGNVFGECNSTNEEHYDDPIVVLVNGNSASASEILTAALKDYKMATVVGKNTFGKGIVQSIIPLGDGTAVKLTTAKYFTPNGNDIHKVGVAPDVEVDRAEDYTTDDFQGEKDLPYQKGIEILKEKIGK